MVVALTISITLSSTHEKVNPSDEHDAMKRKTESRIPNFWRDGFFLECTSFAVLLQFLFKYRETVEFLKAVHLEFYH